MWCAQWHSGLTGVVTNLHAYSSNCIALDRRVMNVNWLLLLLPMEQPMCLGYVDAFLFELELGLPHNLKIDALNVALSTPNQSLLIIICINETIQYSRRSCKIVQFALKHMYELDVYGHGCVLFVPSWNENKRKFSHFLSLLQFNGNDSFWWIFIVKILIKPLMIYDSKWVSKTHENRFESWNCNGKNVFFAQLEKKLCRNQTENNVGVSSLECFGFRNRNISTQFECRPSYNSIYFE